SRRHRRIADMAGKQVEFPPGQRHSATFERVCLVLSVVLVVLVLIINNV
ncbi:MAG: hypothetical protein QOE98_535, partial [Gaiellaceae bacterium]|nr:hypothetical protein [Gaiellaceae bacterium]